MSARKALNNCCAVDGSAGRDARDRPLWSANVYLQSLWGYFCLDQSRRVFSLQEGVFSAPPARAELTFRQLTERQSLELSCSPQRERGSPTGLSLYHRGPWSQTTLLSLVEGGGEVKVDPEHRERLLLCGGLDSLQVNATLSHLRPSDSGLYVWELSYGQNSSDRVVLGAHRVFLLVDGAGLWFVTCSAALV